MNTLKAATCTSYLKEKKIWFENEENLSKAAIDSYLLKIGNLLDRVNLIDRVIKLDKKTEKNRGLHKKIQKQFKNFER